MWLMIDRLEYSVTFVYETMTNSLKMRDSVLEAFGEDSQEF
jgi:hypothetical protein